MLPLSAEEQVSSYVLQLPDGERGAAIAHDGTAQSCRSRRPRRWEIIACARAGEQERLDRGFSVNVPAEMSRLDRVPAADAVKALGSERARVATNREEIEMRVGLGRVGRELFPILILAVALAMAAEQLLANRFYSGAAGAEKARVGEWERGREGENASEF